MSTVRIDIDPAILQWIQKQVNLENIKNSLKDNFYMWLNGEKKPTFRQIEIFSEVTHIPLGYFFLSSPPQEDTSLLEYRTVESRELSHPSRDLLDTITEMENVQEWMRDYLESEQADKLNFVHSMNIENSIQEVVYSIRETLSLEETWYNKPRNSWESFKFIREKLEDCGVIVMMNGVVGANTHRSLDITEFRAFTLVDIYAPLIFINAKDSKSGRLFSLLHELTHIWFGVNSLYNEQENHFNVNSLERKCNAVAAELLVPNRIFLDKWHNNSLKKLEDILKDLSSVFKCGITVIARRAYDNKLIDQEVYQNIAKSAIDQFNENNEINDNKPSGGNYYNTALTRIDKRVLNAMYDSVYSGKASFTDIYRLTNTNRKTFDKIVQKSRGGNL